MNDETTTGGEEVTETEVERWTRIAVNHSRRTSGLAALIEKILDYSSYPAATQAHYRQEVTKILESRYVRRPDASDWSELDRLVESPGESEL